MSDDMFGTGSRQVRNQLLSLLTCAPRRVATRATGGRLMSKVMRAKRSGASACVIGKLKAGRTECDAKWFASLWEILPGSCA
jgi:hypothetical protein